MHHVNTQREIKDEAKTFRKKHTLLSLAALYFMRVTLERNYVYLWLPQSQKAYLVSSASICMLNSCSCRRQLSYIFTPFSQAYHQLSRASFIQIAAQD